MTKKHIAVIDIGKTNAKLALVDADTLSEIEVVTRPNTVLPGPPWPHFDIEGHWEFLLDGLARFHADHRVDAIAITTHGASIVLLDREGNLAAPMLDYEHPGPNDLAAEYDAIRPGYDETGSPRLSMGQNVGAQLFWQFRTDPGLRARLHHLVTYPEYWGGRLTGVAATEVTSLGSHTDLWNPTERGFSSLVDRLGIAEAMAPTRKAGEVLGPILPGIAERTGLAPDTPVHCGIHDSNASLLPHLLTRAAPFSVVSTGTWVIAMAIGGDEVTLDPARDTLINVNAFGDPVPSARFMGGREYDLLMQGTDPGAAAEDIAACLDQGLMLLPSIMNETGPFQGRQARWHGPEPASGTGVRSAAVGFYLALVTAHCLSLIGHRGAIHVEGPFARNRAYLAMLASATGSPVHGMTSATGTSQGAALLARDRAISSADSGAPVSPDHRMAAYARDWAQVVDRP